MLNMKSMQNSTFYVLLRPIFAPKIKIAPPTGFGSRSCEGIAVIWTRIVKVFGSGAQPKSVKPFFFGVHLILTEKAPKSNSREKKIWVKFVYSCIKFSKKPPLPFAKSWLRDCEEAQLSFKYYLLQIIIHYIG